MMVSWCFCEAAIVEHLFATPAFLLPIVKNMPTGGPQLAVLVPIYLVSVFAMLIVGAKLPSVKTVKIVESEN
jgi:hypothetical protein